MKVAIDISQVIYGTGVSVYVKNIVTELLAIDRKNLYLLYGGSLRRKNELYAFTKSLEGNFNSKILSISPSLAHFLWNQLHALKVERFIGKVDVVHTSDWAEPPSDAFKVTTIHDVTPLLYPKDTHPTIVSVHKQKFAHAKKETDRIIVPTNATKLDIIGLGMKEDRIRVIPEALDPTFLYDSKYSLSDIQNKLGIKGEYILMVGTAPRKNITRAVRSFNSLNGSSVNTLVIVGNGEGSSTRIKYTGHLPADQLVSLYKGARALFYPSLYEGFGLPILEAFASHIPVVTSDRGAMKEVAGGAAILVDPLDIDSMVSGLEQALGHPDTYTQKGTARLKEFSWKKAAQETLSVYEESQ